MRPELFWRTSTFQLSVVYALVFALVTTALLGAVYVRSATYMTGRADAILEAEARSMERSSPGDIARRITEVLAFDGGRTSQFGLFDAHGRWLAGGLRRPPPGVRPGGAPEEKDVDVGRPARLRLISRRLPGGGELVVGRNVDPSREVERLIASALAWTGVVAVSGGLVCGLALSLAPIRRLRGLERISREIAAGDMSRRMPASGRGDELDMFVEVVNAMVEEIERSMAEVKASADTLAHDLRTPLTRVRARLNRLHDLGGAGTEEVGLALEEIETLMERFRAILRISEIEVSARRAGFAPTDLAELVAEVLDLYQPLAEHLGVTLTGDASPLVVQADRRLLFEALANLVDNALKFSGAGARVSLRLESGAGTLRLVVQDDGPGVPERERSAVLNRFYRGERDRLTPGSGLGLAVVAAIVRLHRWRLRLEDAGPGLRVVIEGGPPEGFDAEAPSSRFRPERLRAAIRRRATAVQE
jgi:signal transduction histidine kinase